MKFLYPGFRNRALTFSYDDATVEDIRLADLFRKYRLQATFNLNSGLWEHCDRFDHGGYPVVHRRMAASLAPEVYRPATASSTRISPCFPRTPSVRRLWGIGTL